MPEDKNYIKIKKKNSTLFFKKEFIIKRLFFPHSYGFRPNKSAHECLNNIRHWRNTTVYLLDYDIAKAFDEVNRNRLKNIFSKYIVDKRFWGTINKILSTGVAEDFTTFFEHKGVAQGSIISPFLFNTYMHELDKYIVGLQTQAALTHKEYVSGTYGNPEAETNYRKIAQEFRMGNWAKCIQKYGSSEKVLEARRAAYKEHHNKYGRRKGVDPEVRHIQYVRYADDFLIGVVGGRNFAIKLQKDINKFIKGNLHLRVKKDEIVHRNKGSVRFLGHDIKLQGFKKK